MVSMIPSRILPTAVSPALVGDRDHADAPAADLRSLRDALAESRRRCGLRPNADSQGALPGLEGGSDFGQNWWAYFDGRQNRLRIEAGQSVNPPKRCCVVSLGLPTSVAPIVASSIFNGAHAFTIPAFCVTRDCLSAGRRIQPAQSLGRRRAPQSGHVLPL